MTLIEGPTPAATPLHGRNQMDLPCKTLLMTSSEIDPYAGEDTIDLPLDDFQMEPDEGTFDAL